MTEKMPSEQETAHQRYACADESLLDTLKRLHGAAEKHMAERDAANARAETAERDAERYRWLRDQCLQVETDSPAGLVEDCWVGAQILLPEHVDAEFDAARALVQEGK